MLRSGGVLRLRYFAVLVGVGLLGCGGAARPPVSKPPNIEDLLQRGDFDAAVSASREAHASRLLVRSLTHWAADLLNRGYASQAVAPGRECVAVAENAGLPPVERALCLDNLALALFESGQDEVEAEGLFHASIAIRETLNDDAALANSLGDLGTLYERRGNLDRAEELQRRALELYRRAEGPDSANVAITTRGLAGILADRGQHAEAAAMLESTMPVLERSLGPTAHQTLLAMHDLAAMYNYLDREPEAERLLRRVVEAREAEAPDQQRELATSLFTLARALQDQQRFDEAEPLLERSLSIFRNVLWPSDPRIPMTLVQLAQVRELREDTVSAEHLYREAILLFEQYPADPMDLAWAKEYLGRMLSSKERLDEATALHEQALEIMRRERGEQSHQVTMVLVSLAVIALEKNDLTRAEDLYRSVIATRRQLGGPSSPRLISPCQGLARVLQARGDPAAALELLEQARSIATAVHGAGHPVTEDAESEYARGLIVDGRVDEGSTLFEDMLARTDATTDAGARRREQLLRKYAGALRAAGAEERALEVERRGGGY